MRVEKILALLIAMAFIMKLLHLAYADIVLILSLTILALVYFPGGVYFFSDKKLSHQNIPLSIIAGLNLSIAPYGILFKLMHWPMAQQFLQISILVTPLFLAISLVLYIRCNDSLKIYYRNLVIRTSILTLLVIFFYMIPIVQLSSTHVVGLGYIQHFI